jgi:hypothetical protein
VALLFARRSTPTLELMKTLLRSIVAFIVSTALYLGVVYLWFFHKAGGTSNDAIFLMFVLWFVSVPLLMAAPVVGIVACAVTAIVSSGRTSRAATAEAESGGKEA